MKENVLLISYCFKVNTLYIIATIAIKPMRSFFAKFAERTERRMAMKTKFKLSCLFLAALMLFSLTACGKDNPEPSSTSEGTEQTKPPVEAGSGTTIHTNLWDLTYDEADGWVYEEDDFHDD